MGIDYGTSTSKIVFRDYGAPGGERALLLLHGSSFRIPSRVCVTRREFLFGDESKTQNDCEIYESVKMQAAAAVSGHPNYYFGPPARLPSGFDAVDLATLTVWFLISEAHRGVLAYLSGRMEGVSIGMTMGVPMAFFNENALKRCFLSVARRAWHLYRQHGLLGTVLPIEKASRLLLDCPGSSLPAISEQEVRDWIRAEGEAAMWWPFQSPAVPAGPYAKIDIGAGTSHSSLYRIYGDGRTPKRGMAFFGAVTIPVGMDAVDRAISESEELGGDCLALRGLEQSILNANGKARGAIIPVREQIYEAYRKAWIQTYRKINGYAAEVTAWRNHRMFTIGGGSLVPTLTDPLRVHPSGSGVTVAAVGLEPPPDLVRADGQKIRKEDLPFITVAYGLSNIGLSIPEAFTPDEVPPMPEPNERRTRLDRDDIYAM